MTSLNPPRMGSYEFVAWLEANMPAMLDATLGSTFEAMARFIAETTGYRVAHPAESPELYLGGLHAHLVAHLPPPAPRVVVVPDMPLGDALQVLVDGELPALRPGEARLLLVGREVPAGTPCEDLPIQFTGSEPVAPAHVGDRWPYHLCMPAVEWPVPPAVVIRPNRPRPDEPEVGPAPRFVEHPALVEPADPSFLRCLVARAWMPIVLLAIAFVVVSAVSLSHSFRVAMAAP